jgi:hypothetical protein
MALLRSAQIRLPISHRFETDLDTMMTKLITVLFEILTLSCRSASRLSSVALDRELLRRERIALKLHLLCCSACRRFQRQVTFIDRAVHQYLKETPCAVGRCSATGDALPSLPPEARERIKAALRET